MKTCTIDGCDRQHRAKGYCSVHYNTILAPDRHRTERNCEECCELYVTTRTNGRFCSLVCRDAKGKREAAVKRELLARVPPRPRADMRGPLRRAVEDGDDAGVLAALKARTVTSVDGCWVWQGKVDRWGYPTTGQGMGHRLALAAHLGASLGTQPVHHACANTRCINPRHLQPVTHRENAAEMLARGYMAQRIAELEAALAALAPDHSLLAEVGLPRAV